MPHDQSHGGGLSWEEAVDFLYDIRCDVVHRGRYFDAQFKRRTDSDDIFTFTRWKEKSIKVKISAADIRKIVLEGAILGCRKLLASSSEALKQ